MLTLPFSATWLDGLDILLLWFLIYRLVILVRGTRAVQMIIGITFLGGGFYVAQLLGLRALASALGSAIDYIPLAIIVLFQSELREGLASFGRTSFLPFIQGKASHTAADELADAAWSLARKKLGAILVIEREQGLKNYIETGVPVDAPI